MRLPILKARGFKAARSDFHIIILINFRELEAEQVARGEPILDSAPPARRRICPRRAVQMPVYDHIRAVRFEQFGEQRRIALGVKGRIMNHAHQLIPFLPQFFCFV